MAILVTVTSILFGFSCKFADLLDEHGLKWFEKSEILFGVIWGALGSFLVLLNVNVASQLAATMIYWVLKRKLEYFNHSLGGSLVLLTSIFVASRDLININIVVGVFIWLSITGFINTYLKTTYKSNLKLMRFLRLRLRLYIIPVVLYFITKDASLLLFNIFALGTNELTTIFYSRNHLKINTSPVLGKLNFRYVEAIK